MPSAAEVSPEKWSRKVVLFDNGEYSVISGHYEADPRSVLGERWNGGADGSLGFPNVAGYPVWHVVPKFLEIPMLRGLLEELLKHPTSESGQHVADVLRDLEVRLQQNTSGCR